MCAVWLAQGPPCPAEERTGAEHPQAYGDANGQLPDAAEGRRRNTGVEANHRVRGEDRAASRKDEEENKGKGRAVETAVGPESGRGHQADRYEDDALQGTGQGIEWRHAGVTEGGGGLPTDDTRHFG